ncbi:hypothetical protein F5Y07DRAFT_240522 [Xylaria sp. FL0933]|nr:hypothetical protein F5Y07DRAFT_240522 [Xylaria sp. FL0933]
MRRRPATTEIKTMAVPLLPVQSATASNRSTGRATVLKWLGVLLVLWGVACWVRFSGVCDVVHCAKVLLPNYSFTSSRTVFHYHLTLRKENFRSFQAASRQYRHLVAYILGGFKLSIASLSTLEDDSTDTLGVNGSVVADASLYDEESGEVEKPVPVAASPTVRKHTDRVAVIVEDRPLGNLIPVLLHFHSVLGPEWPMILYTSKRTATTLLTSSSSSSPFSRAVASSAIEIRHLPPNTTFASHASVSQFLASPFLWTDLAPYAKVLLFQADSILCGAAPRHVDDFLAYDLVGAPIAPRFGAGFNGGLSLRSRELVLRVLRRWDFAVDSAVPEAPREWRFEDQWFYARMRDLAADGELQGELGIRVNLPDADTAGLFAVETVWVEGARPLGFHQPRRWQEEHMEEIMAYCPEVGMIAGPSFFGR